MEFDELLITTGVDALVRTVKEKQKVELQDLAEKLSIEAETLEEWARVLEEEGIIKIEYSLARTYLVWIQPTQEEVASEKQSFYEEKTNVVQEVTEAKQRLGKETGDLTDLKKSFDALYGKLYPKMEKLEKVVSLVPAGSAVSGDLFASQQDAIEDLSNQLNSLKSGLEELREEIAQSNVSKETRGSGDALSEIEKTRTELIVMKEGLKELQKRASQQTGKGVVPEIAEMKKKYDSMKKDFNDLRGKNSQLKQDMLNLQESSEILKSVAEAVMGKEEKIAGLKNEVESLSGQTDKLSASIKQISQDVKKQADIIDRVDETVTIAKQLLARFPSQEKIVAESGKLEAAEENLEAKMGAMEKLLEAAADMGGSSRKYTDLAQKIDDKISEAEEEMQALGTTLQEEKSTYMTFQKIKEKIVSSMDSYQKQVDRIEAEIGKIMKEAGMRKEALEQDTTRIRESLKKEGTAEVMKAAEEIREKKVLLGEVKQSIEELSKLSDNLNKRITLLARESQILEIRMNGKQAAGEKTEEKEREVHREMELTKEEELEFKQKREELKALIKKLWEE